MDKISYSVLEKPFMIGMGDAHFLRYAQVAALVVHDENGHLPGRPPLSKADIGDVLKSAL